MNPEPSKLRRAVVYLMCLAVPTVLYSLSQVPALPSAEAGSLAERFRFEKLSLPQPKGFATKTVRKVQPCLAHFESWISSLGAGVSLGDLDGDGLPNDLCCVDPRIDPVVIVPAPGTPQDRYAPFALDFGSLVVDDTMAPTGTLLGDFNEDGRMDVLVYFWGRSPIIFLQQSHSSSAAGKKLHSGSFVPSDLVDPWERWNTSAATHADLDGDGHCDLVLCNYGPDNTQILNANASGLQRMQHSFSRAFNGGGKHFFLWEKGASGREGSPAVKFRKVDPGLDNEAGHGWTLACGSADLDGDGLPEVYIANDFGPDRLLHNRSKPGELKFALLEGERSFTMPRSRVIGQDSFKGMGVDFADVNGDGWLDLFVSNIASPWGLMESHFLWQSTGKVELMQKGIAPYRDASEELGLSRSGWGWDCRLADFDNDSVLEAVQAIGFLKGKVNRWPELQEMAIANDQLLSDPRTWPKFRQGEDDIGGGDPNSFFVRAADGRYYDVARQVGVADAMLTKGIAVADVDGDGLLDYAVANQWEDSFLYRNKARKPGAFLGLHLRLPVGARSDNRTTTHSGHPTKEKPSRPAIGAAVTVHLPDGRRLVSQVDGGSGHSGKRAPDVHFGLGDVKTSTKLKVDVRWRGSDGTLRSQTLHLTPGWHTTYLAPEPPEEEGNNRD